GVHLLRHDLVLVDDAFGEAQVGPEVCAAHLRPGDDVRRRRRMLEDVRTATLRSSGGPRPRLHAARSVAAFIHPRPHVGTGDEVAAGLGEGAGEAFEGGRGELVVAVEETEVLGVDMTDAYVACRSETAR